MQEQGVVVWWGGVWWGGVGWEERKQVEAS